MYILLLRVKFFLFFNLLPSTFSSCSSSSFPKETYQPCRAEPTSPKHPPQEVSISFRTVISASHFHSNSGSVQRTRAKRAEKPKKPFLKLLSCDLKWKRAQRSGKRPQDLKAEWYQIYWRKFSKIKFLK